MMFPAHQQPQMNNDSQDASPMLAAQASPLGDQLYFALGQVHQELQIRMQYALTDVHLDIRQYTTLALLADGYRPAQHDLAKILHLDPSQVVKLVKGLEVEGLLVRQTDTADRRAKVLAMTTAGQQRYEQAAASVEQVYESFTAALSRRDRHALASLLHRLLPVS